MILLWCVRGDRTRRPHPHPRRHTRQTLRREAVYRIQEQRTKSAANASGLAL
ncbi:MAG: hypothetical protein PUP92_19465 [Rhizonema sp. PD38]|nr:hypothetical protein [Rhizonema sp. PD38]